MREQRECLRAKPTFVRDPVPRKSDLPESSRHRDSGSVPAYPDNGVGAGGERSRGEPSGRPTVTPLPIPRSSSYRMASEDVEDRAMSDDDNDQGGGNTLVSSNLQNPSDALRLLASASSLHYTAEKPKSTSRERPPGWVGSNAALWCQWQPIQQGYLTVQDARALFSL